MGTTTGSAATRTLDVGSLQLDFYDVAAKNAVFPAVASKTSDTGAKPDKQQKNLTKAIEKMLKDYLPRPGK